MAYSLETLSGLEQYMLNQGFDQTSTNDIINYLEGLGYTPSSEIPVDIESGANPVFNPAAVVDIATSWTASITATGNAKVVLNAADANTTVSGPNGVAVAASSGTNATDGNNGDNQFNLYGIGTDSLYLGTGNNSVLAYSGNDSVFGGTGAEYYVVESGDAENLRFTSGTGANQFWDYGSGHNAYDGRGTHGNDSVYLHNSGSDTVYLGGGTDLLDARQSTGHNTLYAGSGTDSIYAGQLGGTDSVVGGVGADSLFAGLGGDTLVSGSGAGGTNFLYDFAGTGSGVGNLLEASASGNDSLYAHSAANDTLESGTGSGNDYLEALNSTGADSVLLQGSGTDTVLLGPGQSTVSGGTATGNDLVQAYGGLSTISLGSGTDSITINTQNENGTPYAGAYDSINAGTGADNVYFIGLSRSDVTITNPIANVTEVSFGTGANKEVVDINTSAAGSDVTLWFKDGGHNIG